MIPMLAPDGTPGDIPQERVSDAVKSGFKLAAELTAPTGEAGLVPVDRVHDAINAGFQLRGAAPSAPQPDMQTSFLGLLQGGPTDVGDSTGPVAQRSLASTKVPRSIQNAPDELGEMIGGAAALGAAAPVADVAIPAARAFARAHPWISGMAGSELISKARQIPYVGKFVPPYAEMLPWFQSGGKEPQGTGKVPAMAKEPLGPPTPDPALLESQGLSALPNPNARAASETGEALSTLPRPTAQASEGPAPQEQGSQLPADAGQSIPRTLSGDSALRQVLTGQNNKNLLAVARSRGINVSAEAQLKPGVADNRIINKIIDDFSPEELDAFRDTYLENTRFRHQFGDVGPEAWQTMSLQQYFPDLKIPQTVINRTQKAVTTAKPKPASDFWTNPASWNEYVVR